MLKRTKGRFLLTLLVITGLAGTLKNSTLTKPERKLAVNDLKQTRDEFLQSIKGLSNAQLNFKPKAGHPGIKEYIYHLTQTEKRLWARLETAMKEPATTDKRPEICLSDDDLVKSIINQPGKPEVAELSRTPKLSWQSTTEAVSAFKALRADHIKYTRSTTEDLRNHFLSLPSGQADAYQLILSLSAYTARYTLQINEIKKAPGFPKNKR
jgi:hypothetical protein